LRDPIDLLEHRGKKLEITIII